MTSGDVVAGAFLGVILIGLLLWLRRKLLAEVAGEGATWVIARPGGGEA